MLPLPPSSSTLQCVALGGASRIMKRTTEYVGM
jgi:hypothetical protein